MQRRLLAIAALSCGGPCLQECSDRENLCVGLIRRCAHASKLSVVGLSLLRLGHCSSGQSTCEARLHRALGNGGIEAGLPLGRLPVDISAVLD